MLYRSSEEDAFWPLPCDAFCAFASLVVNFCPFRAGRLRAESARFAPFARPLVVFLFAIQKRINHTDPSESALSVLRPLSPFQLSWLPRHSDFTPHQFIQVPQPKDLRSEHLTKAA